ncbi:Kinesin light chain [Lachnellula willkommii]|uniref:Kinesin light chain n=1 Tax=Lachnellula willkommii TaxID=215461 RepID=A0A559MGY0_9HELO|nr:Kinesin light chain [Lachnellula willkommii]
MAAAAYTKDLLYRIAPNKIEAEKKIGDILSSVHESLVAVTSRLDIRSEKKEEVKVVDPLAFYLVPNRRVLNFVGREDILEKIDASFSSSPGPHHVVLCGLGGQGKTQIVLEYCHRTRKERFRSIFWVQANSESTVKKSFQTIAEKIKAPDEIVSDAVAVSYVLDKFREWPDPWLMVFDNYDDVENFENIQDFIPDGEHGCVLFTSRHSGSMDLATDVESAIDLPGLAESEALELLFQLTGAKKTEASISHCQAIVQRLGCHPLAITQAGSYIKKRKVPLHKFIDEFNRRKRQILEHTPQLTQYRRSLNDSQRETSLNVFTTWELSFDQLLRSSSGQNQSSLLTLFAFFDGNDISEQIFSTYCEWAQQGLDRREYYLWPVQYFEIYLDEKRAWNSDGFCVTLSVSPPLTGSWNDGDLDFDLELAVRQSLMSHTSMYIENMRILYENLHAKGEQQKPEQASYLLDNRFIDTDGIIAAFLKSTGQYDKAIAIQCRLVMRAERVLGHENSATLTYMSNLANIFIDRGELEHAEKICREVLERRQRTLGPDHPKTLSSIHDLAHMSLESGNYEAAENMMRRVSVRREELFGLKHRDTLRSLRVLAEILMSQDKYEEAEPIARQVLEGYEKLLGPQPIETLRSAKVVAAILLRQGRMHDAESITRRVLDGRERKFGKEHPETLGSLADLGCILVEQGKVEAAEEILLRALKATEKVVGLEHRDTLSIVFNLARLEERRKEYARANALYQRVCACNQKKLGAEHPDTIRCAESYASFLEMIKEETENAI